jgi:hypothetical protein
MNSIHHKLFLLLLLVSWLPGRGQTQWELKKDKNGIKVYSRNSEQSKFNQLRAELTVKAKPSDLAAFILDIPGYNKWSYNTKTSYILKTVSPAELYFYTEINSPWPASNRDLVVHLLILQDPHSKVITILAESVPDFIPEKKGVVRIPLSKERWTVTPIDKTNLKIEYQLEIDPGASAPAWLINAFASTGPFETFKNLMSQIQEPRYRDAKIPFILN